jgi:hypothetical protein
MRWRRKPVAEIDCFNVSGSSTRLPCYGNRRVRGLLRSLLVLLLLALPLLAQAAPRIGLLTMAPGDEYWARFGHNALLVAEPDGRATSYNYGYFDFAQPGFLLNFLRGRMLYQLVAIPAEQDIAHYASDGRGVELQWLNMSADQARSLADFLAWNALPENAEYRYDYFFDNCSTRVRDAIDRALGGELQRQTRSPSRGFTARSESLRLSAPLPWLYLGIHFGLGPVTDQPLSRWDESFIPQRLLEAVREVRLEDGRPLVTAEQALVEHRLGPVRDEEPRSLPWFFAAGLILAVLASHALRRRAGTLARTSASVAVAMFWLLGGLVGLGLVGLWAFTDHSAAWGNWNILLAPPLLLGLLPALPALHRDRPLPRWLPLLAIAVVAGAVIALIHVVLARGSQDNSDWIALLLPLHVVLAQRLWESRAAAAGAR